MKQIYKKMSQYHQILRLIKHHHEQSTKNLLTIIVYQQSLMSPFFPMTVAIQKTIPSLIVMKMIPQYQTSPPFYEWTVQTDKLQYILEGSEHSMVNFSNSSCETSGMETTILSRQIQKQLRWYKGLRMMLQYNSITPSQVILQTNIRMSILSQGILYRNTFLSL